MKVLLAFGLLCSLLVGLLAKEIGECQVSQWDIWSACQPSKLCATKTPQRKPQSYSLPAAKYDAGRERMKLMMKEKEEMLKQLQKCEAEGTCPDQINHKRLGFTPCVDGFADRYPCRNVDILSFLNFDELGYINRAPLELIRRGTDIWGWTDTETGHEYAIMGLTGGTSFVRITNPTEPEVLAFMYTRTFASFWRDMKVIDNTAYLVSEASNHGLQVFDLLRLRGMNQQETVPIVEPDATYSEFGNAHNIVANEETKFLYVVGANSGEYPNNCAGGLHVINVSNRLAPVFAGCFDEDGYVHDAQCVIYHGPDTKYQNREICFSYNEDTFTIVDVHDKNSMVMVSKQGYTSAAYTHQGWLTEDHTIALMDDEQDEVSGTGENTKTYMWDVTSLENPVLKHTYYSSQEAIDHNQYVVGDYTYQSNYKAGLRILHIDQVNYELNEVGYLDTYPFSTNTGFSGTWSNYPYFQSGNVIISSIDFGMFVARPNYEAMKDEKNKLYSEKSQTRKIVSCKKGVVPPTLEGHTACVEPAC